ncbi:MAG: hypothetical protein RLZZ338_3146 [Cyanobacteriota bacterium]|jgi:hypothetical protein
MKLEKTTLVLMLLALGFGSIVYFVEIRGKSQKEDASAIAQKLVSFKNDDIQSFTVNIPEYTLTIERFYGKKKPGETDWRIKSPFQGFANEASVAFLLDKITTGKRDRALSIPANSRKEYGLEKPPEIVEIKLKNGESHKLVVGNSDFTGKLLYAEVDPPEKPNGNVSVVLIPLDFRSTISRPISDWTYQEEKTQKTPEIPAVTPDSKKTK